MANSPTLNSPQQPIRGLIDIAWPALLELCLIIAIGVLGTLWAAHISDQAGAAFSLSNQLMTLLALGYKIVSVGIAIVIAQSMGRGRKDMSDNLARAALGACTWLCGSIALTVMLAPSALLKMMHAPTELLPIALPFLQLLAPTLLLDAWNSVMIGVLRAQLRVRELLVVMIFMQFCHLCGALVLMPRLGLPGFALALVLSRVSGFACYLWLWRYRLQLVPRPGDWYRWRITEIAWITRIGLPGAAAEILYRLAFMASLAASAQLGAESLATQAYSLQINYAVLLFGLAISIAVEIMIGRLIGAGQFHLAHQLLYKALAIGVCACLLLAIGAALGGRYLLAQFTQNPAIIANGALLLWITVVIEPGRTLNLVMNAALRATGDARYPVVAGAGSLVLVLGAGSWLLAVYFKLGLIGIWLAFVADEWGRGLLMWRRWSTRGWLPHAKAVRRRLRQPIIETRSQR